MTSDFIYLGDSARSILFIAFLVLCIFAMLGFAMFALLYLLLGEIKRTVLDYIITIAAIVGLGIIIIGLASLIYFQVEYSHEYKFGSKGKTSKEQQS